MISKKYHYSQRPEFQLGTMMDRGLTGSVSGLEPNPLFGGSDCEGLTEEIEVLVSFACFLISHS